MKFSDIGLITDDVKRLCRFYEQVFNVQAEGDEIHATVRLPGLGIALYNRSAAESDMGFDFTSAGAGFCTIDFDCEDADAEYERIASLGLCVPTRPQVWPWGAKSFRFADPDGHIILVRSLPGR